MTGTLLRGALGALLTVLLGLCACGAHDTTETRVRSALEVLQVVVDPAFAFSTDACTWREAKAVAACEAGSDAACDEYDRIKQGCLHVRAAFREIRRLHSEASALVEDGKVQEAEAEIARVRALWQSLRAETADGGTL